MNVRFLPASDRAMLVELQDLEQTLALFAALQADRFDGIADMVPAACTILIEFLPYATNAERMMGHVQRVIARLDLAAQAELGRPAQQVVVGDALTGQSRLVEIPVVYEGADLIPLAELLGIETEELIERHTGCDYQAAFAGFAPGFVYLAGGHASFNQVPRLASPRTKVPAGSVAMAGHFSAVYPKESPGGWQLLGTTSVAMWDLSRTEPALVQPGFRVRFVDVTHSRKATFFLPPESPVAPAPLQELALASQFDDAWNFTATGLQTIFQDLGRLGQTGMGVSASGALDRQSMREANRLVGNPVCAPVIEHLLGGLQWRCQGSAVLAITGARVTIELTTAHGQQIQVPQDQAFAVDDGDCVRIRACSAGVRCYVAVRGGYAVQPVLGSCATDTLAMVGPAAVQAGDVVQIGQAIPVSALRAVELPLLSQLPFERGASSDGLSGRVDAASRHWPKAGELVWLDVVLGPRTDWFDPQSVTLLTEQAWEVTAQSNRVGIRLAGAQALQRQPHYQGTELPSEGTVLGALQVPANGQPVLFLADHPLTGGYPVIGAVASHHMDLAAQIPPGAQVRFRVVQPFVARGLDDLEES